MIATGAQLSILHETSPAPLVAVVGVVVVVAVVAEVVVGLVVETIRMKLGIVTQLICDAEVNN